MDQGRTLEALKKLEKISRYDPHNPIIDKLQAEAAMGADQPWLSHESMADYYIAYGQFSLAQEQLELRKPWAECKVARFCTLLPLTRVL